MYKMPPKDIPVEFYQISPQTQRTNLNFNFSTQYCFNSQIRVLTFCYVIYIFFLDLIVVHSCRKCILFIAYGKICKLAGYATKK